MLPPPSLTNTPATPSALATSPSIPKPWPEVAALNPYAPVPDTDEKLRPPTPALLGLKDIPPTPAVTPLVAVAIPSTATGGTVVGEGTKGGGLELPCAALTMALLNA